MVLWLWAASLDLDTLLYTYRFLTKGGVIIVRTWLSQASIEEQRSVLHVMLKVYIGVTRPVLLF